MSDNIIPYDKHIQNTRALEKDPTFENFLKILLDALCNDQDPSYLADWWKNNIDLVISENSLVTFSEFFYLILLSSGTPPVSVDTSTPEEAIDKSIKPSRFVDIVELMSKQSNLSNTFFGHEDFSTFFDVICVSGEVEATEKLTNKYFNTFNPDHPMKTVAKSVGFYLWKDTTSFSNEGNAAISIRPRVYVNSECGEFIRDLSLWATKGVTGTNYPRIFFEYIFSGVDEEDDDPKLDDKFLNAALQSNYIIFKILSNYLTICYADVLCTILELPFTYNPRSNDKAALTAEVLNNFEFNGHTPYSRIKITDEDILSSLKNFYSKYRHYRKRYYDGASPLTSTTHYGIFQLYRLTFSHLEYAIHLSNGFKDLELDLSVIWSLYLYFPDQTLENISKISNPYIHIKESDAVDLYRVLYESLVKEYQYDAALAFLSVIVFKLCNATNGSLEAYSEIYDVIANALLLPTTNADILHKAIQYTIDISNTNNNKITGIKLQKLINSPHRKWLAIISSGESKTCEFKETLRRNLHTQKSDKNIEFSALKSIAALANTGGGYLFIGISDACNVIGIHQDGFSSSDKFQLHFQNILVRLSSNIHRNIETYMPAINGKEIFIVECNKSKEPIYLSDKMFVRRGPSTVELSIPDAVAFIQENFD